jgi:hypothetical protein
MRREFSGHDCCPLSDGIVYYGTEPSRLREAAKSPIRLNPDHSSTLFRVRLDSLKSPTTYYYAVDSAETNATSDHTAGPINSFSTP